MALGDIGLFQPTETQFTDPGKYDQLLRAESSKRGVYLSQMDQFYEQLEETERQFDETLGFKTATRDLELEFAREELTERGRQFDVGQKSESIYQGRMLDLKEQELQDRRYDREPIRLGGGVSDKEQFDWATGYLEKEQDARVSPRDLSYLPQFKGGAETSTGQVSGEVPYGELIKGEEEFDYSDWYL